MTRLFSLSILHSTNRGTHIVSVSVEKNFSLTKLEYATNRTSQPSRSQHHTLVSVTLRGWEGMVSHQVKSLLMEGGIWVQQVNSPAVQVGESKTVKNMERKSLPDVISAVTLTFSQDGQSLYFIDHEVDSSWTFINFRAIFKYLPAVHCTISRILFN